MESKNPRIGDLFVASVYDTLKFLGMFSLVIVFFASVVGAFWALVWGLYKHPVATIVIAVLVLGLGKTILNIVEPSFDIVSSAMARKNKRKAKKDDEEKG